MRGEIQGPETHSLHRPPPRNPNNLSQHLMITYKLLFMFSKLHRNYFLHFYVNKLQQQSFDDACIFSVSGSELS